MLLRHAKASLRWGRSPSSSFVHCLIRLLRKKRFKLTLQNQLVTCAVPLRTRGQGQINPLSRSSVYSTHGCLGLSFSVQHIILPHDRSEQDLRAQLHLVRAGAVRVSLSARAMVEFDNIPGYMSMSIPDWVVYVVMLILISILGIIVWQAYKVSSCLI
jgi:hypothetical protein